MPAARHAARLHQLARSRCRKRAEDARRGLGRRLMRPGARRDGITERIEKGLQFVQPNHYGRHPV
jgi:hypothetical protein